MCVFCKIIAGEIPSDKVYEDEDMVIIRDLHPQAKIHLLMIPKEHYANVREMDEKRSLVLARMLRTFSGLADGLGLKNGFRLVCNTGADGRQTVEHLHVHVLGGEPLNDRMA